MRPKKDSFGEPSSDESDIVCEVCIIPVYNEKNRMKSEKNIRINNMMY